MRTVLVATRDYDVEITLEAFERARDSVIYRSKALLASRSEVNLFGRLVERWPYDPACGEYLHSICSATT